MVLIIEGEIFLGEGFSSCRGQYSCKEDVHNARRKYSCSCREGVHHAGGNIPEVRVFTVHQKGGNIPAGRIFLLHGEIFLQEGCSSYSISFLKNVEIFPDFVCSFYTYVVQSKSNATTKIK